MYFTTKISVVRPFSVLSKDEIGPYHARRKSVSQVLFRRGMIKEIGVSVSVSVRFYSP